MPSSQSVSICVHAVCPLGLARLAWSKRWRY